MEKKKKEMNDSLVFRCERFRFKLETQPPLDFLHTGPVNLSQHDFLSDEPDVPGCCTAPPPGGADRPRLLLSCCLSSPS